MVAVSAANGGRVSTWCRWGCVRPTCKVEAKRLQQSEGLELPRPWLVQRSALQKAERKVEMSESLGKPQAS